MFVLAALTVSVSVLAVTADRNLAGAVQTNDTPDAAESVKETSDSAEVSSETADKTTPDAASTVTASSKNESSASGKVTSSKSESTASSKVTSSKSESTASSKTASSKNESSASGKVTSSKNESTASSKAASSKSESTASSKVASSKNESTASSKVTSSKNESTASGKVTSSKNESSASSKAASSKSERSASQKEKDSEQKKVLLEAPCYLQGSDMPTGCELVSARMALKYCGIDFSNQYIVSKVKCSELKVDKKGRLYGKSPFENFIGDPGSENGFGCYPPVIIKLIDDLSIAGLTAENVSSQSLEKLSHKYLDSGTPVMVWLTIEMRESYLTDSWYLTDENGKRTDKKYRWRAEEHCMLLVGYDDKYYYLNDPLGDGKVSKYEKSLVEQRYKEIGSYSVVIEYEK